MFRRRSMRPPVRPHHVDPRLLCPAPLTLSFSYAPPEHPIHQAQYHSCDDRSDSDADSSGCAGRESTGGPQSHRCRTCRRGTRCVPGRRVWPPVTPRSEDPAATPWASLLLRSRTQRRLFDIPSANLSLRLRWDHGEGRQAGHVIALECRNAIELVYMRCEALRPHPAPK